MESWERGVDFAVKNTLLQHVEVGYDDNERIIILSLHTKEGIATLVSVYARTLCADDK